MMTLDKYDLGMLRKNLIKQAFLMVVENHAREKFEKMFEKLCLDLFVKR